MYLTFIGSGNNNDFFHIEIESDKNIWIDIELLEPVTVLFRGLVTFAQTLNIEQVHNDRRRTVTVKKMKTFFAQCKHGKALVKSSTMIEELWWMCCGNCPLSVHRITEMTVLTEMRREIIWMSPKSTEIYRNDKLNTLKWWYIIIIILYIHVFQINAS